MRAAGWLMGCFVLALASPAFAQGTLGALDAGASGERMELERQLAQDYATLSTSDCATACRALASMQRAADRICALAPGKSCDDARAKVDDATRRVREQCPTCTLGAPQEHTVANAPAAPSPTSEAPRGGGCAGCNATGGRGEVAGGALTLMLGLVGLRRVRRRSSVRARRPS